MESVPNPLPGQNKNEGEVTSRRSFLRGVAMAGAAGLAGAAASSAERKISGILAESGKPTEPEIDPAQAELYRLHEVYEKGIKEGNPEVIELAQNLAQRYENETQGLNGTMEELRELAVSSPDNVALQALVQREVILNAYRRDYLNGMLEALNKALKLVSNNPRQQNPSIIPNPKPEKPT